MTEQHTAWRSTGLHWESAAPILAAAPLDRTALRPAGPEQRRRIAIGERIDWALAGPRRCTGMWTGTDRTPCPTATAIPATGPDAQCRACASADHGRGLARDAVTDPRDFALYLAWFGPRLIKVGLTAADRGRDRLLEQGAIAFTLLATGPHPLIRRAERLVAASGLAVERIGGRAKANAWWTLPAEDERARQVADAYAALHEAVDHHEQWPLESSTPCQVIDQAADFGLTQPPPAVYGELAAVRPGATFTGMITAIIGRQVLLETPAGPLLADLRRIAGWEFTALHDSPAPLQPVPIQTTGPFNGQLSGLQAAERSRPKEDNDDQEFLF